jgi:polar amino acid transport system substrate-binding protein
MLQSTRRYLVGVTCLLVVALAATGCGSSGDDSAADTSTASEAAKSLPPEIADKGKIVFASDISAAFPPYEYFADDGTTPEGFDIDLVKEIGKHLGVEVEIRDIGFDNLIPALSAKRIDAFASASTDTEERQKVVTFVDYLKAQLGYLVPEGNPKDLHTVADTCGMTISMLNGSLTIPIYQQQSEACQKEGKGPVEVTTFDAATDASLAVRSGRADAYIDDLIQLQLAADGSEGAFEAVPVTEGVDVGYTGLGVRKDDMPLAEAIAGALDDMLADGSYQALIDKHKMQSIAVDEILINKAPR